ncbi:hypothetical protein MBLNU457_4227t1 [Dothideomycetes sp. NU457]
MVYKKESNTLVHETEFDLEKGSSFSSDECTSPRGSTISYQSITSTTDRQCLEDLIQAYPLPGPRHDGRITSILSFCSTYALCFTIIALMNLAAIFAIWLSHTTSYFRLTAYSASVATSANILVAIAARNDHVINFLFRTAILISRFSPLQIRLLAARVYSYGGVHSGCAIASTGWFVALVALLTIQVRDQPTGPAIAAAVLAYIIVILLFIIIGFATAPMRGRCHNSFELTHRYLGWTIIGMLWALIPLCAASSPKTSVAHGIVTHPAFWMLAVTTFLVIYPWIHLRKRDVKVTPLSDHAVKLTFSYAAPPPCSGIKLSINPLIETHPFAAIPHPPIRTITSCRKSKGFDLIVSNAGDWTQCLISNPPIKIWTRGLPAIGMMHVALSFRRVVLVVTGSGIAPCLGLFSDPHRSGFDARIVWSTRTPRKTYGEEIMRRVKGADPLAVIVDTDQVGRWDMVRLAWSVYCESRAEVVLVMSNGKVTPRIIRELRSRGVPAMGPIFDS